ncbi:hypothetical protein ACWGNR_26635 [Streptomyces althioticus]
MTFIEAAEKSRDVGDRIGWDMSEGWGMIGAACLAGIFAIVAGVIAYLAGRRQVADQGLMEHKHWQRQNRLEAYQRVLTTADALTRALDLWRIPSTRSSANVPQALDELIAAEAGVRLVGPKSVHDKAIAVNQVAGAIYQHIQRPTSTMVPVVPAVWNQLTQDLVKAANEFVEAAAAVLEAPPE